MALVLVRFPGLQQPRLQNLSRVDKTVFWGIKTFKPTYLQIFFLIFCQFIIIIIIVVIQKSGESVVYDKWKKIEKEKVILRKNCSNKKWPCKNNKKKKKESLVK